MLEPRRLLVFREVARRQSFSRAAEALSLSQPAVSHQVRALERELGTTLLLRSRAGTVPTPAGDLLLAHADALAARLELADAQIGALVAGERGALRLGAFPSALATLIPSAIAALGPDVEVTVEEGRVDELVLAVQSGRMHAAICFQDASEPRAEHDGLRRTDLAIEPMRAILPATHRLASEPTIDLADLAGDPWMAPDRDGLTVRACRAAGFEPRLLVITRDPLAAAVLAAAGLAVSLTPGLLTRIPLPGIATPDLHDPPHRALYAITPTHGAHPLTQPLLTNLKNLRHV